MVCCTRVCVCVCVCVVCVCVCASSCGPDAVGLAALYTGVNTLGNLDLAVPSMVYCLASNMD